jgi:hypothetical protein
VSLNRDEILSSEYIFAILALIMFGVSIFIDEVPIADPGPRNVWLNLQLLLEDGFKLAAISTWLIYFARYIIHRVEVHREGILDSATMK